MGLPGSWVLHFERAVNRDPARCAAILCHRVMDDAVAASCVKAVGTQDDTFSGLTSNGLLVRAPTHRRARRRIRRKVSLPVRLAGLTGQGLHLQENAPYFQKFRTFLSYGTSLSWSH